MICNVCSLRMLLGTNVGDACHGHGLEVKNCMLAYFTLDASMMSGRYMQSAQVWRRGSLPPDLWRSVQGERKPVERYGGLWREGAIPHTGGASCLALCRAAVLELGTCGFNALEPIFFEPMSRDFEFELGLIFFFVMLL